MKFKLIFILFSASLLLFLAAIVFIPMIVFSSAFSGYYFRMICPFILLWALIFFAFVFFYFANRKLFFLLEKEDWPALVRYLEERVIQKGKYSQRLVRLLANSYLVLSDSAGVMNLENKTAAANPALVDNNVLIFGTARILGNDISGAIHFFDSRKEKAKPKYKEWVYWYHGFSLLLNRQFVEAGNEFSFLAQVSKDAVITALSAFFLSEIISKALFEENQELMDISSAAKGRVKMTLPKIEDWRKDVSRLSSEIHAAAISKYLEETGLWLYK